LNEYLGFYFYVLKIFIFESLGPFYGINYSQILPDFSFGLWQVDPEVLEDWI